jgi:broad specificity phosphatase PhoE
MTIFVIRHGETPGNAARIVQTPETPLSDRGIRQAELLGRRFATAHLGGILASDLVRAAMTAEQLAAASGAPVTFDAVLQERNFGDLRGRAYADLEEDLFGADFAPPGGEDWGDFHSRVVRAWEKICAVATETPGDLAVVTHGLVCFSLVHNHLSLESLPSNSEVPMRFGNTAVTVVDAAPPWIVRRLNCTAHLTGEIPPAEDGAPV